MYSHPCNETLCYSCQQKQRYSQLSFFCRQPIWHRQVIPLNWWNPSGFWFIAEHKFSWMKLHCMELCCYTLEETQLWQELRLSSSVPTNLSWRHLVLVWVALPYVLGWGGQGAGTGMTPGKPIWDQQSSCANVQHPSGQPELAPCCTTRVSFQYAPPSTYCTCITSISLLVGSS